MGLLFLLPHFILGELSSLKVYRHIKQPPTFRSYAQANQDMCIAAIYGNSTRGYYVDLASNHATTISNTYVLDRILGWQGTCIEPQAVYLEGYKDHRTCNLVSSVVSPNKTVDFVDGNGGFAGVNGHDNHVIHGHDIRKKTNANVRVHTTSDTADLRVMFKMTKVPQVIDYMSLDIEGYETIAMHTFPFDTHSIKVMTVERPGKKLHRTLIDRGMCVSHNGARWCDLLYINTTLWKRSFVRPAACIAIQSGVPNYVHPSDMCSQKMILP